MTFLKKTMKPKFFLSSTKELVQKYLPNLDKKDQFFAMELLLWGLAQNKLSKNNWKMAFIFKTIMEALFPICNCLGGLSLIDLIRKNMLSKLCTQQKRLLRYALKLFCLSGERIRTSDLTAPRRAL